MDHKQHYTFTLSLRTEAKLLCCFITVVDIYIHAHIYDALHNHTKASDYKIKQEIHAKNKKQLKLPD